MDHVCCRFELEEWLGGPCVNHYRFELDEWLGGPCVL